MSIARSAAATLAIGIVGCGGSEAFRPEPTFDTGAPVIMNGTPMAQERPADLTIRYIERLPLIDYVWDSQRPDVDGWPVEGQAVTWRAHLRNWRSERLVSVDYQWLIDSAVMASGVLDLPPQREVTLDLPWSWTRRRHLIELRIDTGHRFTVPGGPRNRLRVFSDALSLGLYVEQSVEDYFREHQHELRVGNSAFEDWAHLQVELWNTMLERAVFPETPQGVQDRIRLDRITVVSDGALPLDRAAETIGAGFDARQARPDIGDRSVDLQWGFPAAVLSFRAYDDHTALQTWNQFYFSGFMQHELGHARYLVDVAEFDVHDGVEGSRVAITEGGRPVVGTVFMPAIRNVQFGSERGLLLHETRHKGLMNAQWTWLDRYSAAAMNRIAGRRAVTGNYNQPLNIGAFLAEMPRENRLTLRDSTGQALDGARVRVYDSVPNEHEFGGKYYDDVADLERTADAQGRVLLGPKPFGSPLQTNGHPNATLILRVEHEGKVGYGFLEASEFNLEYWRGHADMGEYDLRVSVTSP